MNWAAVCGGFYVLQMTTTAIATKTDLLTPTCVLCFSLLLLPEYGSPEELMIRPEVKKTRAITVNLVDVESGRSLKKRMPLQMSLQTLQGLVIKLFQHGGGGGGTLPALSYVDAEMNDINVMMDNMNKTLDYYSIRDGDTVLIKW